MTCTLAILSSRGARGQEKLKIENTRKICNETSQKSDTHTHEHRKVRAEGEGPVAIFSTEYQKNRNTQKTYMRFSHHLQISSHSRCSNTFNHDLQGSSRNFQKGWKQKRMKAEYHGKVLTETLASLLASPRFFASNIICMPSSQKQIAQRSPWSSSRHATWSKSST
jgi:hypothetical protein